jgi:5-methylcytosine-specific restriction endonuclease McrA
MGTQTLVLNSTFEPILVVSWQKAIQLLFQGKVEVIEESSHEVRTVRISIRIPAVLRLLKFVPTHRGHQLVRFSRMNVFLRDSHRCQYCGGKFNRNHLTLDHVIPVVQGGRKSWDNIVTACKPCNQKKGGKTPQQASMKLVRKPEEPHWLPRASFSLGITITPESWKIYLERS